MNLCISISHINIHPITILLDYIKKLQFLAKRISISQYALAAESDQKYLIKPGGVAHYKMTINTLVVLSLAIFGF